MEFINYISLIAVPFVIFFIVSYGFSEKIKVFDSFLVRLQRWYRDSNQNFPYIDCFIFSNFCFENFWYSGFVYKITFTIT